MLARRPLKALLLNSDSARANGAGSNAAPGELELAVSALDELDREINGEAPPLRVRPLPVRVWVEDSLARWQTAAGRLVSPVALRWQRRRGERAGGPESARQGGARRRAPRRAGE